MTEVIFIDLDVSIENSSSSDESLWHSYSESREYEEVEDDDDDGSSVSGEIFFNIPPIIIGRRRGPTRNRNPPQRFAEQYFYSYDEVVIDRSVQSTKKHRFFQHPYKVKAKPELPFHEAENDCVVCYYTCPVVGYRPCRHAAVCQECTDKLIQRKCPLCRRYIDRVVDLNVISL